MAHNTGAVPPAEEPVVPVPVPVPEPEPEPGRRRRRWRFAAVGGALLLLVAGSGAWLLVGGERAHERSEADARSRLGGAVGAGASGPEFGLYRYEGSGSEETSFPPLTEHQGPRMPATVTPGPDGCWVLRIDYNTHHYQQWTYCMDGGRLTERGGSTYTRRVFGTVHVDNVTTMTCDPPTVVFDLGGKPGAVHRRACTGSGTVIKGAMAATGVTRTIGEEILKVGNRRVRTVHVRYTGTYTGAQDGTERTDDWFATSNGMLVRNDHHIAVETESPVGRITYTEDAGFSLTALQPVE